MQKNVFLASHPAINLMSRSLSTLSSVARTTLTISNALNLMFMQQNGFARESAENQYELAKAYRDKAKAIADGDPVALADAEERINIILQKQKDLQMQKVWNDWNVSLNGLAIGLLSLKSGMDILVKLGPALSSLRFMTIAGVALAPLVLAITSIAAAAAVWLAVWEKLNGVTGPFSSALESLSGILGPITKAIIGFFTISIPNAIGTAGAFLTQFFLTDLPNWASIGWETVKTVFITVWNAIAKGLEGGINGFLGGFESFVNAIINGINKIIRGLNKLPGVNIGQIGLLKLPRVSIPTIAAANGFNGMVNSPTMFLAGEAGPESVSITPRGRSGGGSGTVIVVNVSGSILTEKELYKRIDENLKNELRRRNYRLLQ